MLLVGFKAVEFIVCSTLQACDKNYFPEEKKNSPLYSFPKVAVTEYHKPDDIKWQHFIVSWFWRLPSRKLECWQDHAL